MADTGTGTGEAIAELAGAIVADPAADVADPGIVAVTEAVGSLGAVESGAAVPACDSGAATDTDAG